MHVHCLLADLVVIPFLRSELSQLELSLYVGLFDCGFKELVELDFKPLCIAWVIIPI